MELSEVTQAQRDVMGARALLAARLQARDVAVVGIIRAGAATEREVAEATALSHGFIHDLMRRARTSNPPTPEPGIQKSQDS